MALVLLSVFHGINDDFGIVIVFYWQLLVHCQPVPCQLFPVLQSSPDPIASGYLTVRYGSHGPLDDFRIETEKFIIDCPVRYVK